MKNFIYNTLGNIISVIVMVIALVIFLAIGGAVFALVMNHGGDIFTSLAAGLIAPIGIMDWLNLI